MDLSIFNCISSVIDIILTCVMFTFLVTKCK